MDQSQDLGWIKSQLRTGHEFHQEVKTDLREIKVRLQSVEQRPIVRPPERLTQILTLAREVASLKEWLIGAALVALSLKGILSPAEMKSLLLTLFGLAPK